MLSVLALGFTHYQDLSYQIFELEDSGLPQQGILPISARKTIIMANHICLEKDSLHCGFRVDMSKALHLVYTLHPKTLTNPLLTYNLTKPLTLTRLIEKFQPITNSHCFFRT